MSLWDGLYYGISILIWLYLAVLVVLVWRPAFVDWLQGSAKGMYYLLGVSRLPDHPTSLLKRFFGYLAGGWTWLLVWSWWLMPQLKLYFYKSISNEMSFKVARISTMVVLLAYGGVGFFAIAKAITIWYKKIYQPHLQQTSPR